MALVPKIKVCVSNKCDKVDIYEQTGPYHATTNVEGWVNSGTVTGNIDTSEIVTSDLKIYDFNKNTLFDTYVLYNGIIDVYSGVAGAPLPSEFLALSQAAWLQADGVYELVYTITSAANIFTNKKQCILNTCNIKNCILGLKAKTITECNSDTLEKIKDKINQLEILLYGINSAFSCLNVGKVTELIGFAKTICDNLCDCGCGDC